jgi:ABC-type molybdate transport system substrate-binding protein
MKFGPLNRWAVVGVVLAVLLVNLQLATSQSQQRVQSTTQLSVRTPVAAQPMADWEKAYVEAMNMTAELTESGSSELAEQVENDLRAMDVALREYVRAADRLRHRDRAVAATIEELNNHTPPMTRLSSMMSNMRSRAHQTVMSVIDNFRG